jgi:hypothetical protein
LGDVNVESNPGASTSSHAPAGRLLFVTSDRVDSWALPGLPRATTPDSHAPLEWCAWRLIGGNNREVARGAGTHPDFYECYETVRRVQQNLGRAVSLIRRSDAEGLWAWRIMLDGRLEAGSGRLYQRHRECEFNLRQFLALMPHAATAYDDALQHVVKQRAPEEIRLPDVDQIWLPDARELRAEDARPLVTAGVDVQPHRPAD